MQLAKHQLTWKQTAGKSSQNIGSLFSLVVLDLGDNKLNDSFPIWLAKLQQLEALVLGLNQLRGVIPPEFGSSFPKLQVLDLSNNKLTGQLPNELYVNRHPIDHKNQGESTTITKILYVTSDQVMSISFNALYLIAIRYKGKETSSYKFLNIFTAIDLSNNRFTGKIPDSIGGLVGVQSLNLSHNNLTGGIPSSIGNLLNLEALDLSDNHLSGLIPPELTKITFLAGLNVSYNRLKGVIPQSTQFNTFGNDSFEGNMGLCCSPLTTKCRDQEAQSPSESQSNSNHEEDDDFTLVDWIVIAVGNAGGLVVGVAFGKILVKR